MGAVAFWDNYNDYLERRLTVDESLKNTGGCIPCLLRLAEIDPGEGVSVESNLPIDLGELQPAGDATVRIKFRVPAGVGRFNSQARFVCAPPAPTPAPQPAPSDRMTIAPSFAWANQGCPVQSAAGSARRGMLPATMAGTEMPGDISYGPRLFTATLVDENGVPMAGRSVKWSLSNNISFRIMASTGVTDELGQVTALVTPPEYFICISPYFSQELTVVGARSAEGQDASAIFVYSRCA